MPSLRQAAVSGTEKMHLITLRVMNRNPCAQRQQRGRASTGMGSWYPNLGTLTGVKGVNQCLTTTATRPVWLGLSVGGFA